MSWDVLLSLGMDPVTIAFTIFVITFVLEDAVSVGAAFLASIGLISLPLALSALSAGGAMEVSGWRVDPVCGCLCSPRGAKLQ